MYRGHWWSINKPSVLSIWPTQVVLTPWWSLFQSSDKSSCQLAPYTFRPSCSKMISEFLVFVGGCKQSASNKRQKCGPGVELIGITYLPPAPSLAFACGHTYVITIMPEGGDNSLNFHRTLNIRLLTKGHICCSREIMQWRIITHSCCATGWKINVWKQIEVWKRCASLATCPSTSVPQSQTGLSGVWRSRSDLSAAV